jgi:hypothetical protein
VGAAFTPTEEVEIVGGAALQCCINAVFSTTAAEAEVQNISPNIRGPNLPSAKSAEYDAERNSAWRHFL